MSLKFLGHSVWEVWQTGIVGDHGSCVQLVSVGRGKKKHIPSSNNTAGELRVSKFHPGFIQNKFSGADQDLFFFYLENVTSLLP